MIFVICGVFRESLLFYTATRYLYTHVYVVTIFVHLRQYAEAFLSANVFEYKHTPLLTPLLIIQSNDI